MCRPKIFFGKGWGSQTVLVAHHDQLKIKRVAYLPQIADGSGIKGKLVQAVHLKVHRRLLNQSAIPINKQSFFHGQRFHVTSGVWGYRVC